MKSLTLAQTIVDDLAFARRFLRAYDAAPYLLEVVSTRAHQIIQHLTQARLHDRPCGVLLIALRLEDPVLWSLGAAHPSETLPEELTKRLQRKRGVDV